MTLEVVLDVRAPPKPPCGAPCNGCGVCCAAETCPLGIILFRTRRGPCPALGWDEAATRYVCDLLARPRRVMGWLPTRWGERLAARWISAGSGCDSRAASDPP
ncbi:hypothetical protein [Paramagnetospirillum marisnigri]|uniref:hypothetical protein n=1 Tax=Paramagnetospirillum marisnigri TaxID=1285242 RepID=UPI000B0ECEBB|nr:hypothetical protein [Paramagnetospirillum marisnigri]